MRCRGLLVAVLVVLPAAAGCGGANGPPTVPPVTDPLKRAAPRSGPLVACTEVPFRPAVLTSGPTLAPDDPLATAVAELPPGVRPPRRLVLRVAARTARHALLIAPTHGDAWYVLLERDRRWGFAGSGRCPIHRVFRGRVGATWTLPAGVDHVPSGRRLVALVSERACSSGASLRGRVYRPLVEYSRHAVVVTFTLRPLPPAPRTCIGVAPTPVRVDLREPIAGRTLLDGYFFPPRRAERPGRPLS